jgi:hypothetical protein
MMELNFSSQSESLTEPRLRLMEKTVNPDWLSEVESILALLALHTSLIELAKPSFSAPVTILGFEWTASVLQITFATARLKLAPRASARAAARMIIQLNKRMNIP